MHYKEYYSAGVRNKRQCNLGTDLQGCVQLSVGSIQSKSPQNGYRILGNKYLSLLIHGTYIPTYSSHLVRFFRFHVCLR